eukprot:IDg22869t1
MRSVSNHIVPTVNSEEDEDIHHMELETQHNADSVFWSEEQENAVNDPQSGYRDAWHKYLLNPRLTVPYMNSTIGQILMRRTEPTEDVPELTEPDNMPTCNKCGALYTFSSSLEK